jgi:hypothetical protein
MHLGHTLSLWHFKNKINNQVPNNRYERCMYLFVAFNLMARTSKFANKLGTHSVREYYHQKCQHVVAQLVEALRNKPEGRGLDSR